MSDIEPAAAPLPPAEEPVATDIRCPSCETVIRNVRVEPGAKVRCLNCGAKFSPYGEPPAAACSAAPREVHAKKPRTAGYWLLRIPAIVACAAAIFGSALIVYNVAAYGGRMRFEEVVLLSYLPLLPWAGLFLFVLTRSLARVELGAVDAAWQAGRLSDSLPQAPGSSLPYVAPLAITGGTLPLAIALISEEQSAIVISGIVGAGLFYLGFAFDDLRQFVWRQQSLARSYSLLDGPTTLAPLGLSGWLLTLGVMLFCVGCLVVLWDRRWATWERVGFPTFLCVGAMATSISALFIGRQWDQAVHLWRIAAKHSSFRRGAFYFFDSDIPAALRWACLTPTIWAVYSLIYILCVFNDEFRYARGNETLALMLMWAGTGLFAFWMSTFLAQVIRWRQAHASFSADTSIRGLSRWLFWGLLLAAALETVLFTVMFFDRGSYMRTKELFLYPILLGMFNFPAVWLAFLLREFTALESAYVATATAEEN